MAHPALKPDLPIRKAHPTLTSDHVGTNPIIISERPSTYIWSTHGWRKAQHFYLINTWSNIDTALTSNQHMIEERHNNYIWSTHDWRKAQHLYLTNTWSKKGSALIANQHMIEERLCTYIHLGWNTSYHNDERACTHIWSCKNQSYSHVRMTPSLWISYLVTDHVPSFS